MVELDKENIEKKLFSSELSFEDSKVFKELMVLYPWCSSFKVAYLKSLKTQNDLRFSSELEKYAVDLNSRSVIYDLTKSNEKKASEETKNQESDPELSNLNVISSEITEEQLIPDPSENPLKENTLDKLIESEALAAQVLKDLKDGLSPITANDDKRSNTRPIENDSIPEVPTKLLDVETPRSFNDWLSAGSASSDNSTKKEYLTFEKPKVPFFSPIEKAKESLEVENLPVSETLAKVFESQGNYKMAKSTYAQLILIFPEKKSFFADQIQKLNNKIK